MLADSRIVYLFLYVTDLAASTAFYRGQAGSSGHRRGRQLHEVRRRQHHPGAQPRGGSRDSAAAAQGQLQRHGLPRRRRRGLSRRARARGASRFLPTSWYQPGGIADFYDPDGHWLTLYEPSKEAMSWPSGDRIRAVLRARASAQPRARRRLTRRGRSRSALQRPVLRVLLRARPRGLAALLP